MNTSAIQHIPTHDQTVSLARLSEPNGYRFDGDTVHLHARFVILERAAHRCAWALQLWACPSAPSSASDLAGQIVAEVALPPMSEVADEIEHLDMTAFSRPPAGNGEYFMALVLAAGRPGHFNEVHDVIAYPCRQRFLQPAMRGNVGYRIEGDRVHLSVGHIENPRDAANCSGTLALELWAMPAPYAGGNAQGARLAGTVVGALFGQHESTLHSFELPYAAPPPGDWHFVLMLREWTSAGYVTRDFTNFTTPVTCKPAPVITPPVKLIALPKPVPVPTKKPGPTPVSVNTAAEEELAAIDGITPKLARSIEKKRPFASLDDLRRVRGISAALLAKIRSRLKL